VAWCTICPLRQPERGHERGVDTVALGVVNLDDVSSQSSYVFDLDDVTDEADIGSSWEDGGGIMSRL
jgi:hypothetical protein